MTIATTSQTVREIHDEMLGRAPVTSRHLTFASGRRVHVVESGDGPPLLLLHGGSTSSLSHLGLHERLPSVRAISVDRPGCGLSDPAPVTPCGFLDPAVRFIDEAADRLGLGRFMIGGNSMGGLCSTWYALARPERVRGLVLLGSAPALPGTRVPPLLRLAAFPGLGDVLARAKVTPDHVVRLLSSVGEGDTIRRYPDLVRSVAAAANDPTSSAANLVELRAVISAFGFRRANRVTEGELRQLSVPALLVWGDHDPVASVRCARRLAAMMPEARLEVLAAGHVPFLGHPQKVARLLAEFTAEAG